MNSYYDYPEKYLWTKEAWEGTDADIQPLVKDSLEYLYGNVYPSYKTGLFTGRADGTLNPKSNMRILPDVTGEWEKKGLEIHISSMGFTAWIAAVPKDRAGDAEAMLRFHSADLKDPLWAMDSIEYYRDILQNAADSGFAVLFMVYGNPFPAGIYMDIILEFAALWRLELKNFYMDARPLLSAGKSTGDFAQCSFHGIPALDISDRWMACTAHQFIVGNLNRNHPEFDFDRLINSTLGRNIAHSMRWEHEYRRWDDAGLLQEFSDRGLDLEGHFTGGERWLTVAPKDREKPLPLLVCVKEVRPVGEFMALTALQFYHDFIEIAANGEFMMLFFALESPDDNEQLTDIISDAKALYPVDESRIYIVGQSHNGCFALDFAGRHPELITAVATLNDRHGIASPNYSMDSVPVTDAMVDSFARYDMPLINICGAIENVFTHTEKGTAAYANAVDAFHRRLAAFRCPDKSDAEIEAALTGSDRANRINGVPGDRSEIVYTMGFEAYISDIQNTEGKWHLRFVTLENMPHMISPQMAELSWSFLRRFSRDKSSGEIRE